MPNHVRNILTIDGSYHKVKFVLDSLCGDENHQFMDFNKVIPMPSELVGTMSPVRIMTQEEYDKYMSSDSYERDKKMGCGRPLTQKMSDELKAKYGHDEWYTWSIANWGTKWNAYDQSRNDNVITFSTAWSHPLRIIETLSTTYPELIFNVMYADEDRGSDCGEYVMVDGHIQDCKIFTEASYESLEFADEVWGDIDISIIEDRINELDDEITLTELKNESVSVYDVYTLGSYYEGVKEDDDFSGLNDKALRSLMAYCEFMGDTNKLIAFGKHLKTK
jgi:Ferredoxin-like domain in Api92-like protein